MMSEPITLEFLGARVAALTDQVHDMEARFTAMEARFSEMEGRLGALATVIEIRFDAAYPSAASTAPSHRPL